MKVSAWKKFKLYLQYRKALVNNLEILSESGLRIDRVKRIYTVINVPETLFESVYDLKTSDINRVSQSYITERLRNVSKTLNGIGLSELFKTYETKKVDKYSYLVIIGFSLFDTKKVANNLWFKIIPTIAVTSLLVLITIFFK
jgi:hypothetical protein